MVCHLQTIIRFFQGVFTLYLKFWEITAKHKKEDFFKFYLFLTALGLHCSEGASHCSGFSC